MGSGITDGERFLQDFHSRFPGATADAFRHCAEDGRSPYDLLCRYMPASAQPLTVVDLACGDGALLEQLMRCGQPLRLVGVDVSERELALARRRLPAEVELRLERAQQLSLPDATADVVVCHLALMLMDPVEPVVRQIARVLKPGGSFVALVSGDMVRGDAWEAFVSVARSLVAEEAAPPPMLGDGRTQSAAGLRSLFGPETGFEQPVTVEDHVLRMDGTVEQVWQSLLLTYFVGMLSGDRLEALRHRTTALLEGLRRPDGTVPCSLGVRVLHCTRAVGDLPLQR
jgi:SAM-dependent methyltransferase